MGRIDIAHHLGVADHALRKTATMEQEDICMGVRAVHAEQARAAVEIEIEPPDPVHVASFAAGDIADDVGRIADAGRGFVLVGPGSERGKKRGHATDQALQAWHEQLRCSPRALVDAV
jgi:hypothetical protein